MYILSRKKNIKLYQTLENFLYWIIVYGYKNQMFSMNSWVIWGPLAVTLGKSDYSNTLYVR